MHCPSCHAALLISAEQCQECGFSLNNLGMKFGTVPHNFKVSDYGEILQIKEIARLDKMLCEVESHFEDLHLAVMTLQISPRYNSREYIFWLVNRCHFCPMEARLERNFSMVLLFDVTSNQVLLTTGYGLQEAFSEEKLGEMIDLGLEHFKKRNYIQGCKAVLRGIKRHLKRHATGKTLPAPQSAPAEAVARASETKLEMTTAKDLF